MTKNISRELKFLEYWNVKPKNLLISKHTNYVHEQFGMPLEVVTTVTSLTAIVIAFTCCWLGMVADRSVSDKLSSGYMFQTFTHL